MLNSEKDMLLKRIQQLEFICVELNLYLDTHPDDIGALNQYNSYSQQLMMQKQQYEARFGPLLGFGFSQSKDGWKWITEPWPWEVDYNKEVKL